MGMATRTYECDDLSDLLKIAIGNIGSLVALCPRLYCACSFIPMCKSQLCSVQHYLGKVGKVGVGSGNRL